MSKLSDVMNLLPSSLVIDIYDYLQPKEDMNKVIRSIENITEQHLRCKMCGDRHIDEEWCDYKPFDSLYSAKSNGRNHYSDFYCDNCLCGYYKLHRCNRAVCDHKN